MTRRAALSCAGLFAVPALAGPADVRRFGAVADGITDCTSAIQRAIDSLQNRGGTVLVPPSPSPYRISGPVYVRHSHVRIEGSGASLLMASPDTGGRRVLVIEGTGTRPVSRVTVRGLWIDANYAASGHASRPKAVSVRYARNVRIEDLSVLRAYVGVHFGAGTRDCEARRVIVEDYAEDGFDAGGEADEIPGGVCSGIRFSGAIARNAPRARGNAFEIEDGALDVVIDHALIENVAGNGIGIRNHFRASGNIHTRRITVRNSRIRGLTQGLAVFAQCAPLRHAAINSVHGIRLIAVEAEGRLRFGGPIRGLRVQGGSAAAIEVGFGPNGEPDPVAEAVIESSGAGCLRVSRGSRVRYSRRGTPLPGCPAVL